MHDVKSNIKLIEHIPAASQAVGTVNGSTVDLQGFTNVSFVLTCGSVGTGGTIGAKIQHSDDGSAWNDSTPTDTGEPASIPEKSAAFSDRIHVVKPIHRYYRVALTIGTAESVVGVVAVLGGARHKPVKYA